MKSGLKYSRDFTGYASIYYGSSRFPKKTVFLGLYDQATKRAWWMPWRQEAMKDVVACDKLRVAGKQALIRRFPNGETWPFGVITY